MKTIDKYIKEIINEVDNMKKRDSKCTIAYRGENKDYGDTKLMPSLFRNHSYIEKEDKLFYLLKDYAVTAENASQADLLIEAQHYVAISRALDITFSILPALYFACCESNLDNSIDENDGIVYVFGFPEYVSPHSNFIDEYYKRRGLCTYAHNFKVISHSMENERIINQKGGFIFFQGTVFVPINPIYYKEIKIKFEDKQQILKYLDVLFGVNKASLFPDKNNIANLVVKPKFEEIKATEDEFSIQNEIVNAFNRISYEARMEKLDCVYDDTSFGRRLRKENADLKSYIKGLCKEDQEDYLAFVDSQYKLLGGL